MSFTRELWNQIHTMQATKASIITSFINNIKDLKEKLARSEIRDTTAQLNVKRSKYVGTSYQVTVIRYVAHNTGVPVPIDQGIDWRNRFVTIRGFIRYVPTGQQADYLPGGAKEFLLGRYNPTLVQITPTIPISIIGPAQSRVRWSFFTGNGLSVFNEPTNTDPFDYLNENMAFCRIGSEDSRDTDGIEPTQSGSFLFIYAKDNGNLNIRLGPSLKWSDITIPNPTHDMVIALNLFASQNIS